MAPTGSAFANTTPFVWGYNPRGELTSATRNGLTAFERAYSYDGIGNRLTATDHTAATTSYFANAAATTSGGNALNQYAKINYPGSTTIEPQHDADGNLTSGPVPGPSGLSAGVPAPANATLTWDAENRLVEVVVGSVTIAYAYDHQSRLIAATVGGVTTRYLYDGWNRIAEYQQNGTGQEIKRSYLWGMDMSGSMQGAGGVGGLLAMTVHDTTPTTFYPTYDGNGNVSEYINQSGTDVAHFEYDPFGNLTVDRDGNANQFPYRFSTKPQDLTNGLLYYGYRWYDPLTGRWPSRDPIEENGGINLYGFVGNGPVSNIDLYGLFYPGSWYTHLKYGVGSSIDDKTYWRLGKAAAAVTIGPLTVRAMDIADGTNPAWRWALTAAESAYAGALIQTSSSSVASGAPFRQWFVDYLKRNFCSKNDGVHPVKSRNREFIADHGTDIHRAFGNFRLRFEGFVGKIDFGGKCCVAWDLNVYLTDDYTFIKPLYAGYARTDRTTPTAIGYRLEDSGYLRPFSVEARFEMKGAVIIP